MPFTDFSVAASTPTEIAGSGGDAPAAITYTDGTPRGIMLTNEAMKAVARGFMYCDEYHHGIFTGIKYSVM